LSWFLFIHLVIVLLLLSSFNFSYHVGLLLSRLAFVAPVKARGGPINTEGLKTTPNCTTKRPRIAQGSKRPRIAPQNDLGLHRAWGSLSIPWGPQGLLGPYTGVSLSIPWGPQGLLGPYTGVSLSIPWGPQGPLGTPTPKTHVRIKVLSRSPGAP
jgi:hypothetical protein